MIFDYLKEKKRMLNSLGRTEGSCAGVSCKVCPLYIPASNFTKGGCRTLEMEYPGLATRIVREWALAHPAKTRKDILLEAFPNARIDRDGHPLVCAETLGLCICLHEECCKDCWNETDLELERPRKDTEIRPKRKEKGCCEQLHFDE